MTTSTTSPDLQVTDFPLTQAALAASPKRLAAFNDAVRQLNQALVDGAIANPKFTEINGSLKVGLAAVWEHHVGRPHFWGRAGEIPEQAMDLYFDITPDALHLIESAKRKVGAVSVDYPGVAAIREMVGEFEVLAGRVKALKPMIVKRQAKTEAEREADDRFTPTPATPQATRLAWESLVSITERNYDRVVQNVFAEYTSRVRRFVNAEPEARQKMFGNPMSRAPVTAALEAPRGFAGQCEFKPEWERLVRELAERDVTALRERFIYKVLRKVAPIIEAKGGLARASEIRETVRVGTLTGMLAFEFSDRSRFVVDNTVVYSRSVYGKHFERFPLTFHDVVLPDGSQMKAPSEERMHTVFAAARSEVAAPGFSAVTEGEDQDEEEGGDSPAP